MRELYRNTLSGEREIVQHYLKQAKLLPSEVLMPLLQRKIEEEKKRGHCNFLIDGFPREISQAFDFEKQVKFPPPAVVIGISGSRQVADW